ncbi:MAG: universal stress protein [Methanosphaera sp.]|nr:universal stress protein [Methanosphaera sp.]
MYDRILVLTDGSDDATKAGIEAVNLAKKLDATVVITYIFDQRLSTIANQEEEGQTFIDAIKDYAIQENVNAEDLLIYGSRKNDVMIIARKSDADLIVMARHGNTKNKTTLMGEFSEFVVKNIKLPVLLI